jgi:hypothetical protein
MRHEHDQNPMGWVTGVISACRQGMKKKERKLTTKEISNAHLEWYSSLNVRLKELGNKVSAKMQRIRENKEYTMDYDESLANMFFMHLDEYVSRAMEVGNLGVGGTEPDIGLPGIKDALTQAIPCLWSDASMAYIHGNFRGCIFLSATMLEGALKLKIRHMGLEVELKNKGGKPTLGSLIDFLEHDKSAAVPTEVIGLAKRVNTLRVEHVHLLVEEKPEDLYSVTQRDEFVPLDEFRGKPPVETRERYITGDGVTLKIDLEKGMAGILYKHKKDARECLDKSREILRQLYPAR